MPNTYTRAEWAALSTQERGACDEWQGHRKRNGYGEVGTRKYGTRRAHAVAWIKTYGDISEETPCVLHHCDNPPCVNVEHLFLGTKQINALDRDAKRRGKDSSKDVCPNCSGDYTLVGRAQFRRCLVCYKEKQNAWKSANPEYQKNWRSAKKVS